MSYDLTIRVKVEGLDKYIAYQYPEYDDPTYNLRTMFVKCMDWDYKQGEIYNCADVIENIERGIRELALNRSEYEKYNPANGWGTIESAFECLNSLRDCIYETAEEIPIDHLYMSW